MKAQSGRNSGNGSDGGDGGWKAQGTAAAVTVGGGRDAGTQGFARSSGKRQRLR